MQGKPSAPPAANADLPQAEPSHSGPPGTQAALSSALAAASKKIFELDASKGWHSFDCTLITPMYGGGVVARHVDPGMPIRAASIRGQLRFWWRLTQPLNTPSKTLFERESAIWGGIGRAGPCASKVSVRVDCPPVQKNQLEQPRTSHPGIKYAFGSASINANDTASPQWLAPGYSFHFKLRYGADVATEIEAALRWWTTFGGIGARTRRGFGAFRIDAGPALVPITAAEVEAMGGQLRFSGTPVDDAVRAWQTAVEKLRAFRQGEGIGRRPKSPASGRPGRSYWPEPDQLRRLSGYDARGRHEPVHAARNVFPRAAFGLPIIFDFRGSPGDPPNHELLPEGEGNNRMASPLVLRAYRSGERWLPAALLLPGWQRALSQRLRFKQKKYREEAAAWSSVPDPHGVAGKIPPMNLADGSPRADDPLSAFLHFFAEMP